MEALHIASTWLPGNTTQCMCQNTSSSHVGLVKQKVLIPTQAGKIATPRQPPSFAESMIVLFDKVDNPSIKCVPVGQLNYKN